MKKSLEVPPLTVAQAPFLEELEKAEKIEKKIRLCLDFMKKLLSEGEIPQFRTFWETRSLCLQLFKEKLPPRIRTVYWAEFVALSEEIRKIKEILDEQSSFAAEQIELAVEALKKDVSQIEALMIAMDPIKVPKEAHVLKANQSVYIDSQKELDLLGTLSGRLNSLRKELIHTPMRIRHKNSLFGELTKLGDAIFPRRKAVIASLSECFTTDIEAFQPDMNRTYESKEEIKALQSFAKVITVNTQTFSTVREKLSSFWDQLKEKEKERHEQKAKQREEYRESFEKIMPQIELLKGQCSQEAVTWEKAQTREREILEEMRQLNLGRNEVKILKRGLNEALEPLEKKRSEQLAREKERKKLQKQQREKAQTAMIERLAQFLDRAESLTLDALVEKWEILVKEEKTLNPAGLEGERIRGLLDAVYDHVQDKQWHALREDSSEEGIQQLHALLDNRHKARRKLKEILETHRKIVGGSGLSLEQSLLYQEMIGEEKLRLDAIETMIEELEEKLFDVEE